MTINWKKILPPLTAIGILFGLFIIGFVVTNVVMKIAVGHSKEVIVPDITEMHFDVARKKLQKIGLYVREVESQHHEVVEKMHIITQKPHANINTKTNRAVEVVVSKGPEMVRVPYLDNISREEARVRLNNAGLKLGKASNRFEDDVKKGLIIYSNPLADTPVPLGSAVEIVVSLGKLPSSSGRRDLHRMLLDQE